MPEKEIDLNNVSFDFEALEACPFCQGKVFVPNGKIKWLDIDMWYVFCVSCGLKFMNPRPTKQSYQDFYANYFWQQKIRNIGFHQEGQTWQTKKYQWDNEQLWDPKEGIKNRMDKQRKQKTVDIIKALESNLTFKPDTAVLDVGCSFGVTLDEIHKKFNCQVYGIEPSTESRQEVEKVKAIKLLGHYAEELEDVSKTDLKFDVIIFSHVLENTTDPVSVIKAAKQSLKPGGFVYIQTPNLLVFDQMNPYHPYIFSRQSLSVLAAKLALKYRPISELKNKMLEVLLINE